MQGPIPLRAKKKKNSKERRNALKSNKNFGGRSIRSEKGKAGARSLRVKTAQEDP